MSCLTLKQPNHQKPFCFKKKQKLLHKTDFNWVFDKATKLSQRSITLLFRPNERPYARLGIIIGKRVAKLAVSRNQFKRVIRDSFRIHQSQLKGFDIIVIGRIQCDTQNKIKLREGIDTLWKKLPLSSQKE